MKLPSRMEEVLLLIYGKGLREVDVARRLNVSRQAINRALRGATGRLSQIFLELAEILNADIIRVNVRKGYAIFRGRQLNTKIYAFYIPRKGIRVLFKNGVNCRDEELRSLCIDIIRAAKEWGMIEEEEDDADTTLRNILRIIEA